MIPHNLPDYVERGGRQVWRPPYRAREVGAFGFVIACDPAAIDDILERDLVEPAKGAVDYRCAHPSVIVLFAEIGRLTSAEKPDRLRGYIPELEVSVWCLATDVDAGDRLVWYLPYVFTDSGQTVASGREVYGYPKQIGYFDAAFPKALADGGSTTIEALAIDPYDPATASTRRPMIGAERLASSKGQGVLATGPAAFLDLTDLLTGGISTSTKVAFGPKPPPSAAITPLSAPPPPPAPAPMPWARRVLDTLEGRALTGDRSDLVAAMVSDPTLVFLKQFRDVSCPTKACYQAVVEAPLAVDPVGAVYESLDPKMFTIEIEDWDSHPLATDLGVAASTKLTPTYAFRAELEFDVQLGFEVWRAQT